MSKQSAALPNIRNRSPWRVQVRSQPMWDKQFAWSARNKAQVYVEQMQAKGCRATLMQLETAFELRVRRKGIKDQYLTFDSVKAADQARLKLESDLSISIVRDYAAAAQHTLADLMQRYRDDVAPKHKGGDVEICRINRILRLEAFVHKKLAAIATEDLQDFIEDRLTEVAPSSVDRDLDVISQVIRYADDVWKIAAAENPFKGLRRPKYFNERSRRLSKAEEQQLLTAARADENPYIEPAIILALETAMRRGELLALTADDIDVERRQIYVRESKNGRSRAAPMSTRAESILQALMQEGNEKLLNLSANALKLGFFRRVIPASGLEDFHFHDLRHEAISRLAESGLFQLDALKAISGHRDLRMLFRYSHLCPSKLAEKMDLVSGEHETYVHRGRHRKRGKGPVAAPVDALQSNRVALSLPSNVIAFPTRRRA